MLYSIHVKNQGFKALFKVLRDTKDLGKLPPRIAFRLFDALVLPILEYCNELIFDNNENKQIESVHLKCIKIILGVSKASSHLALYGETGRFPLFIRQQIKVFKYWSRLVAMSNNTLTKKAYNMLLDLHNLGFKSWVSHVHDMLHSYNFHYAWAQQHCNKSDFLEFKRVVQDKYIFDWSKAISDVKANAKLRTYCKFKVVFECENYLLCIDDFKLRQCLTKFRISNHDLNIEKGRYLKLDINKRICNKCNLGLVEDEIHFLTVCEYYKDIRLEFFKLLNTRKIDYVFKDIMQATDIEFYLAKCLQKMFNHRNGK